MLLGAVQCCIICRNFGVESKIALDLLHFVQVFSINQFYLAGFL